MTTSQCILAIIMQHIIVSQMVRIIANFEPNKIEWKNIYPMRRYGTGKMVRVPTTNYKSLLHHNLLILQLIFEPQFCCCFKLLFIQTKTNFKQCHCKFKPVSVHLIKK